MKIVKYKKGSKGRYKVYLEDGKELSFYEEVILKFNLLLSKEINDDTLMLADQYNQECDVYYVALHNLESHYKSVYELREWLKRKEYPEELIEKAIDKLMEQGYLNDEMYAKSYVNTQMITTNKGPYRLKRELEEKKITPEIIENALGNYTEEEQEARIRKVIDKSLHSNHNKGGIVLKQKIYSQLQILGYDVFLINSIISQYSFSNNPEMVKKEYEKLKRKYSRKYEGEMLEKVIKEKLYLKGLRYEEE